MRVTVCELSDDRTSFEKEWDLLAAYVRDEGSDLVLLPEFPFFSWFPASPVFDAGIWRAAVVAHDRGLERLNELSPASVLATRPVDRGGRRLSEGFVWDERQGYQPAHLKYYVPGVAGAWEASWFEPGDGRFDPIAVGPAMVGFQICTELWAMERARSYAKQGVHVIVTSRATEHFSLDKFLSGGRVAALLSGAYSLSSNRVGPAAGNVSFGGQGWIVGPEGDILGLTSSENPFVTVDIDLAAAARAKRTYPRDVLD